MNKLTGDGKGGALLILVCSFSLLALSILMVFSITTLSGEGVTDSLGIIRKHLLQILVGLVGFLSVRKVPLEKLRNIAPKFLFLTFLLLLAVILPGVGHQAGGAQRWFSLGPIRIQPGELAKLAMVLYVASYIGRQHEKMKKVAPGVFIPLGIVALFGCLLLRQPDFGTTVILLFVVILQLLLVSNLKHLITVGLLAVGGLISLVFFSPYRLRRFQAFLDPFADASSSGYQLVQSLIAVGSGGIAGQGLGGGKQKLFYLPAAHTDFIFAVICEELGLIGALTVLLLFFLIAIAGYGAAFRLANDPFRGSLAVGLTSLIVVQALLNIGVVTGLLPTKGLVLPLVSYGGSAMLVNLLILGILVGLISENTS